MVWNDNADDEDGYRFQIARVDRDADVQDPASLTYTTVWETEDMPGGFCSEQWGTDLEDWSIYYLRLVAFNQYGDSPADYPRLVVTPLPKAPVITSVSLDYVYEDEEYVPVTTVAWDYDQSIGGTDRFEVEIISQMSGAHDYVAVISESSSNTYEYWGQAQTNQNTLLFRVHAVYQFSGVAAYNEPVSTYYYSPPSAIAGGQAANYMEEEGIGGLIANGSLAYADPVRFAEDPEEDAEIREEYGLSTDIPGMLVLNVDPWGNLGSPGIAGKMDIDMQAIASGQGLGEWSPGAAWGTPTAFIGMSFGQAGVEGLQWGEVNGTYRGWNNWNLSTGPDSPYWEEPGTVVSFWSDGVFAESVVQVGTAYVTHTFAPSQVSPFLYDVLVTVDGGDGYYSRTMNWIGQYARAIDVGETVGSMTTYCSLNGFQLSGDTSAYEDVEAYGEDEFAEQHTTTLGVNYNGQTSFLLQIGAADTEAALLDAFAASGSGSRVLAASQVLVDGTTGLAWADGETFGMGIAVPLANRITKADPITVPRTANTATGNVVTWMSSNGAEFEVISVSPVAGTGSPAAPNGFEILNTTTLPGGRKFLLTYKYKPAARPPIRTSWFYDVEIGIIGNSGGTLTVRITVN